MSVSTLTEIMHDKGALAAACEELAMFLLERADEIKKAAANEGNGFDLARALPLMCAFPSLEHMRMMALRLRAVVRKLDAMPSTEAELARVLSGAPAEFETFERQLFEDEHSNAADTSEGGSSYA
jgi:hypothetical protein